MISDEEKKRKARDYQLRRNFGISLEQYDQLFDEQNGCCAICLRPAEVFNKNLAVDHNHKTGEVRGLVCTYCNRYVIGRHTDAAKIRRLANYLDRHTGWFVPEKKRPKKRKKTNAQDSNY